MPWVGCTPGRIGIARLCVRAGSLPLAPCLEGR